jgi:hypothetical protein
MDTADVTTNRTPIVRPAATMITPRAIELFAELERATRARRRAVDCTIGPYGHCQTDKCGACLRWWDAHNLLCTELSLPPWVWPAIPRNPYPPGSAMAREWLPGHEQQELWNLLDQARRGAVVPSSSEKEESPDVEPVAGPGTFT